MSGWQLEMGACVLDDGRVRFRVWAPDATSMAVEVYPWPRGTDLQLVLDFVRAIVDGRPFTSRLDRTWLTLAVRTVIAGARAGTLTRGH